MLESACINYSSVVEFRHMAILAECDICGNQHRVKDAAAGQSIRCKDCGVQIVVPHGEFITRESFIEENGQLRRRQQVQDHTVWNWFVSGFVACLVLIALIVVIWTLIST